MIYPRTEINAFQPCMGPWILRQVKVAWLGVEVVSVSPLKVEALQELS